jgi:aspartyl protease family protein
VSVRFNLRQGLIIIPVEFAGPSGTAVLRLALDTGATATLVNTALLVAIGYDPALATDRVQVTTGSGIEFVPRIVVQQINALGRVRTNFPVLAHTLPPSAGVDGLLGLDFLREQVLTINFRAGQITLE